MSTTSSLSAEAIAAVDPTDQLGDVLGLPEHLRDALWRVESANLRPQDSPGGLVVAGMGGSAIGGLLALAALGDRASRPIVIARDYGAAGVDDARHDRPVLQLLRRHRGDAGRLRGRRGPRGTADRLPPPAARWPARPAPTACR